MRFFILAAGQQTRWVSEEHKLKQLLPCPVEPLIKRTDRLFSDHGEVFVVTVHEDIAKLFKNVIIPKDNRYTVSTIYSTAKHWRRRCVILLGDVYYSEDYVAAIVGSNKGLEFFGSNVYGEIFAVSFVKYYKFKSYLIKAIKHADGGGRGKIWEAYRAASHIPLDDHQYTDLFTNIHDSTTRDFDEEHQYVEFCKEMGW